MLATTVRRPYTAERRSTKSDAASNGQVSNADLLEAIDQLQRLVRSASISGQADPSETAQAAPAAPASGALDAEVVQVRQEITAMSQTIDRTKEEIAAIKHPLADKDPVVSASSQLDAIVDATESATQSILDATEYVEEMIKRMVALYPQNEEMINLSEEAGGQLIKIMEACGFQDITGQRVTKVVNTLRVIEERVGAVINIWGADAFSHIPIEEEKPQEGRDETLLSGPQLGGQGISQADIDALFD